MLYELLKAVCCGVGIGVVHAACLGVVLCIARRNARDREDETIKLMQERNGLDEEKVDVLRDILGVLDK